MEGMLAFDPTSYEPAHFRPQTCAVDLKFRHQTCAVTQRVKGETMTRQTFDPIFRSPDDHRSGLLGFEKDYSELTPDPLQNLEFRAGVALEATQDQLAEVRELLNEVALYTRQLLTHIAALEQGRPAPAWMPHAEVMEHLGFELVGAEELRRYGWKEE
jgi:hypothetical protein